MQNKTVIVGNGGTGHAALKNNAIVLLRSKQLANVSIGIQTAYHTLNMSLNDIAFEILDSYGLEDVYEPYIKHFYGEGLDVAFPNGGLLFLFAPHGMSCTQNFTDDGTPFRALKFQIKEIPPNGIKNSILGFVSDLLAEYLEID